IGPDHLAKFRRAGVEEIRTLFVNDTDRGPYISSTLRIDPTRTQLDALYEFDRALDAEIDQLGTLVGAVETAVAANQTTTAALTTLMQATDTLLTHLQTRDQAILTGGGLPERPAETVLDAPKPVSPAFLALQNLRLNDALSVLNTNYVVVGRVTARVGERVMRLARLSGGATDTWLWIGETERDLALLTPYSPTTPIDTATSETITIDGDTLTVALRGFGAVDLDGPGGSQKDVPAQLACFRSDLQVLWSERIGAQPTPTLRNGLTVDLGSVSIFRR
ncbi:MAG: hypothetical protein NZ518_04355, partial [Dehalococcoidia bacterium]|nr:hypothetical protein [Dehalococcoidia bacterium]